MSKLPTGVLEHTKQAGAHAFDAAKGAAGAGKDAFMNANGRLSGHIADKGVWGTITHGAGKYPLVAGAAGVTAAYVAATKVMGGNEQRVHAQRAGIEQGMQR